MRKMLKMLRVPPRRVVLWHSIAAVPMATVVVLGGYLSYHYHELSIQNRLRVDHAYEVLDGVDGLLIAVQDANAAQLDFVVTGDEARLAPFQAALKLLGPETQRLSGLLRESSRQGERLAKLEASLAQRLAELGQGITVRRTQGFDAARKLIAGRTQGESMADLRRQVAEMADAERQLLMRRQVAGREHERDILLVGVFIAALSVAMRILVAWIVRRMARAEVARTEAGAA